MKRNHWWFPLYKGPRTQAQRYNHLWVGMGIIFGSFAIWRVLGGQPIGSLFDSTMLWFNAESGPILVTLVLTGILSPLIALVLWFGIYKEPAEYAFRDRKQPEYYAQTAPSRIGHYDYVNPLEPGKTPPTRYM
jgi:hypothetical protein